MEFKEKIKKIISIIGLPLFFVIIFAVIIIFYKQLFELFSDQEKLLQWVKSQGVIAPLVFIGIQILQVIIFILPGEVPQVAGGYIFGTSLGIFYSIIGITIGSLLNYILAKLLGIPFLKAVLKEDQITKFDALMQSKKALLILFFIYLIPGLPKDIMAYAAGIANINLTSFLVVSTIGRIPGIIGSSIMGSSAAKGNWLLLVIIFVVAAVLFIIGVVFKDKILKLLKDKL